MGPPSRQAGDTFLAWSKDARKRMNRLADTLEALKPFAETRSRAGLEMVRDWQLKPLEETVAAQKIHASGWGSPYADVVALHETNVGRARAVWGKIADRQAAATIEKIDRFIEDNNRKIAEEERRILALLLGPIGAEALSRTGKIGKLPSLGEIAEKVGLPKSITLGVIAVLITALVVAVAVPVLGRAASR